MDTHSTRPTTQPTTTHAAAIKADAVRQESERTLPRHPASTATPGAGSTPMGETPRKTTATRPQGFVHTPTAALPTFSTKHVPESSQMGRYISFGVIALLVLLLIFQLISKSSLRRQVRSLESQNATLTERVTSLQQQLETGAPTTPPGTTSTPPIVNPSTSPTLSLFTYPILFRENNFQKIAQTISVATTANISGVVLRGLAGSGSAGQVSIYESPNFGRLDSTKPIVKRSFDTSKIPADQPFSVQFQKPIELRSGVGYLLVVETTNKNASADIAYRTATPTAPGTMWVYSRRLSEAGSVLSNDFSWQELPGYDLFFELRGAE